MNDGAKLHLRQWRSETASGDGRARAVLHGVLHIVHGMAEHSLRYERLAQRLCAEGFDVWAADQRGHGLTADRSVNDPGKGGLLGHCFDGDGFSRVTEDIDYINRQIKNEYNNVPLFLLGHSWGSFICQNYIETYGNSLISGCILSGTRGPGGAKLSMGLPVLSLIAALKGRRKGSSLARAMADGPYSKPFRPNRTSFDWLSRDKAEVDSYINDTLCGKLCSVGFYKDLVSGLKRIHRPDAFQKIPRDLPVFVFSGSADPVGDMGASTTDLVNIYRKTGIEDLEFILYPDARHEPLNETNREEVTANLLAWLNKHTERQER